jgi:hypothetical protein
MSFWSEPLVPWHRRLIFIAAIVLLPVLFVPALPVWKLSLHYVGMHAISPNDFKEFAYLPLSLTLFGLMALMAALANRRDVALIGWLAFTLFAAVMFKDYANWLYHYGHDLDPRAALKLPAFTPPLIGFKKMANFRVWSLPAAGSYLLGVAWLLGPVVALLDVVARKKAR